MVAVWVESTFGTFFEWFLGFCHHGRSGRDLVCTQAQGRREMPPGIRFTVLGLPRRASSRQSNHRSGCVAVTCCDILFVQLSFWCSSVKKKHVHSPGSHVALVLVVARLPSALVGRCSAPVSETLRGREREIDFSNSLNKNLVEA